MIRPCFKNKTTTKRRKEWGQRGGEKERKFQRGQKKRGKKAVNINISIHVHSGYMLSFFNPPTH